MNKLISSFASIIVLSCLLSACGAGAGSGGGSGWMEAPMMFNCADEKEAKEFLGDKNVQAQMGAMTCSQHAKLYGDAWRCEDGRPQVRCK